jgi:hypothetical protein
MLGALSARLCRGRGATPRHEPLLASLPNPPHLPNTGHEPLLATTPAASAAAAAEHPPAAAATLAPRVCAVLWFSSESRTRNLR